MRKESQGNVGWRMKMFQMGEKKKMTFFLSWEIILLSLTLISSGNQYIRREIEREKRKIVYLSPAVDGRGLNACKLRSAHFCSCSRRVSIVGPLSGSSSGNSI